MFDTIFNLNYNKLYQLPLIKKQHSKHLEILNIKIYEQKNF